MLVLSTLFIGEKEFETFISTSKLQRDRECLVRVYTASGTKGEAVAIAKAITGVIPRAKLIGCSASGVIFNGEQFDDSTLVTIEQFDKAAVQREIYCYTGKTPQEMAQLLGDDRAALMHVLMGGHYSGAFQFVEAVNALYPDLKLTGGVAGDILPQGDQSFVFTEEGAMESGIVTASIVGSSLKTCSEIGLTSDPISPVYTVTKFDKSRILEIENIPATLWCREQFGLENFEEYDDWQQIADNDVLIRFPLLLEGHGGAGRFVKYDGESMSLHFSEFTEQVRFRIGYTSPTRCVQDSFDICRRIAQTPVESLFCYSCLFRKLYLGNCAKWELTPFSEYNVSGAFMMGEIGWLNGRNEFLNGACSLVGIAQRECYITPNFSVFEDLYKIKDDNIKLNSFILRKQSTAMSRENQVLLDQLVRQQEKSTRELYVDPATGLGNAIKFAQDNASGFYDKLCMIQIENASLIMNHLGRSRYSRLLKKAVGQILELTKTLENHELYHFYTLNDSVFFVAADSNISAAAFTKFCDKLYYHFQFISFEKKEELMVNRFVVLLNQKNMLEKGLNLLQSSKNLQNRFIVSDSAMDDQQGLLEEMEMLHILNQVIENKWLIPYFQGIYDNRMNRISKYEALMRIHDEKGNIYVPAQFMDIAKKYHLYFSLSRLMLQKVFDLFAETDTEVSINLSVHDIDSEEMRSFILERIAAMSRADNFVFELLEDENFRDMDVMRGFIQQARAYGVRVAIDDFGSGYSSFIEIVRLEPEFIKVDGSIIKNIAKDEMSRKVLLNIAGLGTQLNAEVVAEFVEDEQIQACLKDMDIPYSQGFYFTCPLPYEQLDLNFEKAETK